ncbi:histidinol-phosphate transaminase [Clostridium sp. MB40-C1]|uniref:histidinol-phosphate transaminase n=1 Tax=Clostridium sp. MB40-C1 TaxID=3070996 RepID=UPI0027DF435D|nr:histidinol-phosphate transaminase [Clostridium sp. MB40-C1]WMJ80285.1 histidinol-phosphate transaminase [Clostridium sp. MB40-C1]
MIEKFFREDIKDFEPYEAEKEDFRIRLDANESFIGLGKNLKDKILDAVINVEFNRYPDPQSSRLCSLYGKYCNINEKYIMAGNGSDEIIQIITNAFLDKGDKLAILDPDFSMYKAYTRVRGGKIISISLDKDFKIDVDFLIERINCENPKIFMFSNPNNPTGGIIPKEDIIRIVEKCNCIVVVDEAYVEFYGDSVIDQIKNYTNLIVLRTCSKALGSAILRLGFAITNQLILKELKKVKPPFNVNGISQVVGEVILKDIGYINGAVKEIVKQRDYLYEELSKINKIEVYKTNANFVLFKSINSKKINQRLEHNGIKVRSFKNEVLQDYLRITAGNEIENEEVLKIIKEIF